MGECRSRRMAPPGKHKVTSSDAHKPPRNPRTLSPNNIRTYALPTKNTHTHNISTGEQRRTQSNNFRAQMCAVVCVYLCLLISRYVLESLPSQPKKHIAQFARDSVGNFPAKIISWNIYIRHFNAHPLCRDGGHRRRLLCGSLVVHKQTNTYRPTTW